MNWRYILSLESRILTRPFTFCHQMLWCRQQVSIYIYELWWQPFYDKYKQLQLVCLFNWWVFMLLNTAWLQRMRYVYKCTSAKTWMIIFKEHRVIGPCQLTCISCANIDLNVQNPTNLHENMRLACSPAQTGCIFNIFKHRLFAVFSADDICIAT